MIDAFGVERTDLQVSKGLPSAVRAGGGGHLGQSMRGMRSSGRLAAKAKAVGMNPDLPNQWAPYADVHHIGLGRATKKAKVRAVSAGRIGRDGNLVGKGWKKNTAIGTAGAGIGAGGAALAAPKLAPMVAPKLAGVTRSIKASPRAMGAVTGAHNLGSRALVAGNSAATRVAGSAVSRALPRLARVRI